MPKGDYIVNMYINRLKMYRVVKESYAKIIY